MVNEREKRKYPRLEMPVRVFEPGGKLLGVTKNLSHKGCFIETKQGIKKKLTLTFQLPNPLEKINAPCEVLWENDEGIGIGFNPTGTNKLVLLRYLWMSNID